MNLDVALHGPTEPVAARRSLVSRLTENLRTEARLLRTLGDLLEAQRDAVATDDLAGVEGSVHAVERVLMTLRQARRTRGGILERLGLPGTTRLSALDGTLGTDMTPELAGEIDGLRTLARDIERRLAFNGRLLQHAMERGDRMLRTVYAPAAKPTSYTSGDEPPPPAADALLIDRRI